MDVSGLKKIIFIISSCVIVLSGMGQQDSIHKRWYTSKYVKQSIAPALFIGSGAFMKFNHTSFNDHNVQESVVQNFPDFHSSADDYLRFVAIPAVYGFDWIGIKAKTDIVNRSVILLKGEVLMLVTTYGLKHTTHVERPNGSNDHSFPSGHTAQAFLAAVFIHRELGYKSIWFPIAGYTIAASVGASRILNNDHWTSDVLVGAGIGMMSMNVAYWTHRYKWNKNVSFIPSYNGKGLSLYASIIF
ncbi:MAG: phosphatase PAP2 family protein [Cytophagales bacterium]|nr:phosphatase PAP2 family protein [Cytophaga sp.]